MTDEHVVVADVVAPEPQRVPCPDCGLPFVPGPGLARHMQTTHNSTPVANAVECPECGRRLSPVSLPKHLRTAHGIRKRAPRKTAATPAVREAEPRPKLPVLEAEQITEATAQSLWPQSMPTSKVGDLLEWHRQTQEFLRKVR